MAISIEMSVMLAHLFPNPGSGHLGPVKASLLAGGALLSAVPEIHLRMPVAPAAK